MPRSPDSPSLLPPLGQRDSPHPPNVGYPVPDCPSDVPHTGNVLRRPGILPSPNREGKGGGREQPGPGGCPGDKEGWAAWARRLPRLPPLTPFLSLFSEGSTRQCEAHYLGSLEKGAVRPTAPCSMPCPSHKVFPLTGDEVVGENSPPALPLLSPLGLRAPHPRLPLGSLCAVLW